MTKSTLLKIIYGLLFILLTLSLLMFVSYILMFNSSIWYFYTRYYLVLLLVYTWYVFTLLYFHETKEIEYPKYNNEKISVLVPCYNEKPSLLIAAIESIVKAKGNKEIIVIDDGSTNGIRPIIEQLGKDYNVKAFYFDLNRGKRQALHYAITKIISKSDFVVTIDSDTILEPDSLIKIVEPLKTPNIAASTGNIKLLNENENLLTRMVGTYYWIGLNVYKKAQSYRKMVVCCSGCLAAYKTSVINEVIEDFVNQEFLGQKCTHSEDRHLTNLVLQKGYDVVYVPEAISYTETPSTIPTFLRQQMRWKRGFIRESLFTLTHSWKHKKLLFLQILFWDLTAPFYSFGMRLVIVYILFTNPLFFLTAVIPSWIIFMIIRYIFVFQYAKEKIPGLFIYMLFYEVFLYWMYIYALFTVKNKSWITRQPKNTPMAVSLIQ